MERKVEDILQGVFAEMRQEKPCRELRLHTEPDNRSSSSRPRPRLSGGKPLRLVVAVSGIAAAIVAGIFVLVSHTRSEPDDLVCYVDGARIVDREVAMEYTREALGIVGVNLQRSAGQISLTVERVGEILGIFIEKKENQTF